MTNIPICQPLQKTRRPRGEKIPNAWGCLKKTTCVSKSGFALPNYAQVSEEVHTLSGPPRPIYITAHYEYIESFLSYSVL